MTHQLLQDLKKQLFNHIDNNDFFDVFDELQQYIHLFSGYQDLEEEYILNNPEGVQFKRFKNRLKVFINGKINQLKIFIANQKNQANQKAIIFYNNGTRKNNQNNFYGAIQDFNYAILLNPSYADTFNNRGNAKRNLQDYKNAIEDYNKAIAINPKHVYAYSNRSAIKNHLKDYLGAIEDCNKALQINPKYASPYFNKACAYSLLNNKAQSLKNLQKAIQLDSNCKQDAKTDTDFKNLWNDPDFQKLTQ